ncbi:hypothetical protein DFQ14_104265 [Halopolyspora algeriensis]|uniref:ApeA N-terminal domain-containing protein n=1 Tax=Halopolyspora algeriensis TaxID=1500506 RepID=A0A368VSN2_9ACTN|nr:hypothetical protein [Halopolyspora algeriensis]RCW44675.1 hypothetical protein DFQ14_104265 [Halopolyspora algeriensis]TQM56033.1 hypothetical protein FHU43_0815 [Halopolyspora algeriensis]
MARNHHQEVLDGNIGFFWPIDANGQRLEADDQRGYIHLKEDGRIRLETLDENPILSFARQREDRVDRPDALLGSTASSSVLVLNLFGSRSTVNVGGYRASVRKYSARTLISRVDLENLSSICATGIEGEFFEVERWAQFEPSWEALKRDESGRLRRFSIELEPIIEQDSEIDSNRSLYLSSKWKVTGPSSRRTIYSPVVVGCRSNFPVPFSDLLNPVLAVQNLLSMAYGGFVSAAAGSAFLDCRTEPRASPFWTTPLMHTPAAVQSPRSMTHVPQFSLDMLGGVSGLANWVKLTDEHSRAVKPIVNQYRFGGYSPELKLMEVAAGIEYWVNASRRNCQWARVAPKSLALAEHVGHPFKSWIRYAEKWADIFWRRYGQLKHEPNYEPDIYEISVLADVGVHLLTAELLNFISDANKDPASRYFESPQMVSLKERIQSLLGGPGDD